MPTHRLRSLPGPHPALFFVIAILLMALLAILAMIWPAAPALALGGKAPGAPLEPPVLVQDINRQPAGSSPENFITLNGVLYFAAQDIAGNELWRSDGTAAGTFRVKDIRPGGLSGLYTPWGSRNQVATLNSELLVFAASDGVNGSELWQSDGTAAGTRQLADLCPGACPSAPGAFVTLGSYVYFTAVSPAAGRELWRTNGTLEGTQLVRDINPGSSSGIASDADALLVVQGDTLYLSATDGVNGRELWRSDGTAAGTRMVKDLCTSPAPSCDSRLRMLTPAAGLVFFVRNDYEVWRSDGTSADTYLLANINSGSRAISSLTAAGDQLFFTAGDTVYGRELWASDGTVYGTHRVKDIRPGGYGSDPYLLGVQGNRVLFSATELDHGRELWVSDGTEFGTFQVADIVPGVGSSNPTDLAIVGTSLYFTADDGVHGSEPFIGSWNGPASLAVSLLQDVEPGLRSSQPHYFTSLGGQVIFAAAEGAHGLELWRDQTGTGLPVSHMVELVEDINTRTQGAVWTLPAAFGSRAVFSADDNMLDAEPWISDGVPGSARLLKDIYAGGSSNPREFTALGSRLLFIVDESGSTMGELWATDGTPDGTARLRKIAETTGSQVEGLVGMQGRVYFRALQESSGAELWRSDGTEAGTELVEDIWPGGDGSAPNGFAVVSVPGAQRLVFFATTPDHGQELWTSDGTAAGTSEVSEGCPGVCGFDVDATTAAGRYFYFTVNVSAGAQELWRSDGTPAGTTRLRAFPGGWPLQELTPAGAWLFFTAGDDASGRELWVSDGTPGGTKLVRDIRAGATSSDPYELIAAGDRVYFQADDGVHGYELWQSDASSASLVNDLRPGSASSDAVPLAVVGSLVYFAANDGLSGVELWLSDGTPAGTSRVADINPGPFDGNPQNAMWAGGRLYFVADDGAHGEELFSMRLTGSAYLPLLHR